MTEQEALSPDQLADSSQPADDIWRKEIHSRVAGYRSRRGHRVEGAFSMRFPFPPAETEAEAATVEAASQPTLDQSNIVETEIFAAAESSPTLIESSELAAAVQDTVPAGLPTSAESNPEPEPELRPVAVPRPRSRHKVIAFPRQASEAPSDVDRLADPVPSEQPRILDVPEELEPFPMTPLLDGLQYSPNANQRPVVSADHIELPFQAVRISRRICAGLVDFSVVAAAAGIFGAVSYKLLPQVVLTKPLRIAAAAVLMVLWAVYEYLFTVYGGRTLGMKIAHIRLSTFTGAQPNWRYRRSRVIGIYFSTASLLMGLLWALVDVDGLCWHDRISRTYLTQAK